MTLGGPSSDRLSILGNHVLGTSPKNRFNLSVCTTKVFAFGDFWITPMTDVRVLTTKKGSV